MEINNVINQWTEFVNPATLRRELYDFYFINRSNNCRTYWIENKTRIAKVLNEHYYLSLLDLKLKNDIYIVEMDEGTYTFEKVEDFSRIALIKVENQ